MIYQCYFKPGQESRLFPQEPYAGFGLVPEVNPRITENCPELADPAVRQHLSEYACFLWHWRNPGENPDDWFGTTSYRQLDKSPFIFYDPQLPADLTRGEQVVGWGFYQMVDRWQAPIPVALQAELCHPGINAFTEMVLRHFGHAMPAAYYAESTGLFASYWVMNRRLFDDFMRFSWPLVEWALAYRGAHEFITNDAPEASVTKARAIGYFAERLFVIWCQLRRRELIVLGPVLRLANNC